MSAVRVRLSPPNQKMIFSLKEQLKKTVFTDFLQLMVKGHTDYGGYLGT
jgi:hypothetical protein